MRAALWLISWASFFVALWFVAGAVDAHAADTWSAQSGSYTSAHASGPRSYTYQNVGGVQSWQHDTPGGHSTTTYRPAGTPGYGNYVFDNSGTGATARTSVNVPYAPGKTGTANLSNAIPKASIGKAAAAVLRKLPALGAAAAIYELADNLGVFGCNGDLCKETVPTAPNPSAPGGGFYSSRIEAFNAIYNQFQYGISMSSLDDSGSKFTCYHWSTPTGYGPNHNCYTAAQNAAFSANPGNRTFVGVKEATYTTGTYPGGGSCPEGMTYGTNPAGCWSDGGTRPLTPAENAALDAQLVDGCPGGCGLAPVIPEILANGETIEGPFGPTVITIPDSGIWPGDAQTTTHPDGSQTVTENEYNATANGDTVEVRKTTTVTEKDAQGNTTSVTTTEGSVNESNEPPPPGLCEQFPAILACLEVGPDLTPEPVPENVVDVGTVTPVTLSSNATCPAPLTGDYMGAQWELSMDGLCMVADGMKPIFIALAWLGAAGIVFGFGAREGFA